MNKFQVNQKVTLVKTSDVKLDGSIGRVVGYSDPGRVMVLFDNSPVGYDPAISIVEGCLEINYATN